MRGKFSGFTLLELIVVIIIVGILSTLGLTQYGRVIEKSRGAEAKNILGTMRSMAAGFLLERSTLEGIDNATFGLGDTSGETPIKCMSSHYFKYSFSRNSIDNATFVATRCGGLSGKQPGGVGFAVNATFNLTSNFTTGNDLWWGTGGY